MKTLSRAGEWYFGDEGQTHAFGHRPGPATDRFVDDLAAFLDRGLAPGR